MENKNIIVTVVLIVLVGLLGFLLIAGNKPKPIIPTVKVDIAALKTSAADANVLGSDIDSFSQDEILYSELDDALNDVGELPKEITSAGINSAIEAGDIDALAKDLADFSGAEAINQELDDALKEAAL